MGGEWNIQGVRSNIKIKISGDCMTAHSRDCLDIHEVIMRFAAWLRANYPENVLIPLQPGSKFPIMAHKGGQFTWDDFDECMKSGQRYTEFGVLVRGFIVVDADSPEAVLRLESRYPALLECPCVKTRKGKHYYQ